MSQAVPPRLEYARARRVPANYCNLRHTNEEFILDFGLSGADPVSTVVEIDTSLVVSPFTAKRLWMSLGTLIAGYEQTFGELEIEAENRAIAPRPTPLADTPMEPKVLLSAMKQFRGATAPLPPSAVGVFDLKPPSEENATLDVYGGGEEMPPEPNGSPCIPARFRDPEG